MVIYLPSQSVDEEPILDELTPREIVRELDKHVVGQAAAKRAVAIALRNRIRRQKLPPEMAEEVMPKNILMIGPTGVGKTELARRLAKLSNSPFMKVEASKFTEVGYVGRDVESMIRDLVDIAIDMVREERLDEVADRAELNAEERLLDLLMPPQPEPSESVERTREKLRERLRVGISARPFVFAEDRLFRLAGSGRLDLDGHDLVVELPLLLRLHRILVAAQRERVGALA